MTTHGLIKQHNAEKCNTFLGLMGLTCVLICINKHCQEINLGKGAIIVHIHLPEVVFFLSLAVTVVPTLFELVQVNAYWFGAWKTQMFTMTDTVISLWSSKMIFIKILTEKELHNIPSRLSKSKAEKKMEISVEEMKKSLLVSMSWKIWPILTSKLSGRGWAWWWMLVN